MPSVANTRIAAVSTGRGISSTFTQSRISGRLSASSITLRRFDFPVAPVILGVILGPLMEAQFRRTLLVSDGDFTASWSGRSRSCCSCSRSPRWCCP